MDAKFVSVLISRGSLYTRSIPSEEGLLILRRQFVATARFDQHAQKEIQKILILVSWLQREWIDAEAGVFQAHVEIASAERASEHLVAGAEVKDKRQRVIFLRRLDDEIRGERFATANGSEDESIGNIAPMQIQEVGRPMRGLKDREIFLVELRVPPGTCIDGEQERQVGIVGVQCPLFPQIELSITWNGRKERVEQVVTFFVKQAIVLREQLLKLGY